MRNSHFNVEIDKSVVFVGDATEILKKLPSNSVQCVVTSPPYWGMRDYKIKGQIGLEESLDTYLDNLLLVFIEIKRVLKSTGVLWINIGDGYTSGNRKYRAHDKKNPAREMSNRPDTPKGLKRKDLIGLPWRLAFALQASGWYLRSDIIWHKPNAMPESVKDRPYRSHEYLFMFTKSEKYFFNEKALVSETGKRKRSVWEIPIKPNSLKHDAIFPSELISPCILSSSNFEDFVLDPFFGSGTVGAVCENLKRKYIGIELNPKYIDLATIRLQIITEPKLQHLETEEISSNQSTSLRLA